jgi:hypothetical protein
VGLRYDPTTGRVEDAGTESVNETLDAGGIPEEALGKSKIPMLSPSGKPVFVPKDRLDQAVSAGYKYESPEDEALRKEKEKYDNPALAGTLGVARGVSFGLSDLAANKLGYKEEVSKLKEYNPASSTAGDVVGTVAPAVLSLGTSILGTAARFTAPGLAAKIAANATKATAKKIVGESAIKKAIPIAVGAAVEGGLYGVKESISDLSLSKEEITPGRAAQTLLANVGMGAMLGGGMGFGLSVTGQGIAKGYRGAKNLATKYLSGSTDEQITRDVLESQANYIGNAAKQEGAKAAEIRNAQQAIKMGTGIEVPLSPGMTSDNQIIQRQVSDLADRPTMAGVRLGNEVKQTQNALQKTMENIARGKSDDTAMQVGEVVKDEMVAKLQAAQKPLQESFEKIRESTGFMEISQASKEAVSKSILKDDYLLANKSTGVAAEAKAIADDLLGISTVDQLKSIKTRAGESAKALGVSGRANEARVMWGVKAKLDRMEERWIRRSAISQAANGEEGRLIAKELLEERAAANRGWAILKNEMSDLGKKGKLGKINSIEQLIERFDGLEDVDVAKKLFNPKKPNLMRFMTEKFPEQAEKMRAHAIGEMFRESFDAQDNFQIRKFFSQYDKLPQESKDVLFSTMQQQTMEGVRKIWSALPKHPGSSTMARWDLQNFFGLTGIAMETRDALRYMAIKQGSVIEMLAQKTDKAIDAPLLRFIKPLKEVPESARRATVAAVLSLDDGAYKARLEKIVAFSQDPENLTALMEQNTAAIGESDPDVQAAMNAATVQAVGFLAAKAPKNPLSDSMFKGKLSKEWKPSDQELMKFNRYVRAVDNPLSILQDFEARILTPESVEAVQQVYPELYERIKERAIDTFSKPDVELTYSDRVQISILLGMPVDSSMTPEFIRRIQEVHRSPGNTEDQGSGIKPSMPGLREMDPASRALTPMQKVENR